MREREKDFIINEYNLLSNNNDLFFFQAWDLKKYSEGEIGMAAIQLVSQLYLKDISAVTFLEQ